jgi:hypothetical protein
VNTHVVGLPNGNKSIDRLIMYNDLKEIWKRGWDLNPRPPGYEPDELTGLLYPAPRMNSEDAPSKTVPDHSSIPG